MTRSKLLQLMESDFKLDPEVIEPLAEVLNDQLADKDHNVRTASAIALAQFYMYQAREAGNDFLFNKLTDPLNDLERPGAAIALFLMRCAIQILFRLLKWS
jgi:HEAT repeat protein